MTVAVVGGGAVGVTAAKELAQAGVDVTLYEANSIGGGSTGRAAGILYAAHTDPLTARLGERSLQAFHSLSGTGSFTCTACPYVWFATEPGRDAAAIRAQADNIQDATLVPPDDLGDRWPALNTRDITVAAMSGRAAWIDPAAYASTVADQATAAGATVHTDTTVAVTTDPPAVIVEGDRQPVEAIAVAAGAHTTTLLDAAGISLPMKPYRVQALTVEGPSIPMFWDVTNDYYARPHPTGVLAGDGTEPVETDPDQYRRNADPSFRSRTTAHLTTRLLEVGSVHRSWAGLCTATPDRDPLLGRVAPGIFVATGWHGQGVMRAPATGSLLARAVQDRSTPEPRFDPTRFPGDVDFDITEGMTLPDPE